MFSIAWAFEWLTGAAVISLGLSLLGSMALLCCREPVRRMRIIVLTLAGCVLAPAFTFLPGLPHWSLPRWTPAPIFETTAAISPGDQSSIVYRETVRLSTDELPVAMSPKSEASASLDIAEETARVSESDSGTVNADPEIAAGTPSLNDSDPVHLGPTPSATRQTAVAGRAAESPAMAFDPRPSIVGLYFAGLVGLSGWWLAGFVGLRRVLRAAQPAPELCRELLQQIAGPAADNVSLLVSSRAAQPFTFGWRRPVIVLPTEMCLATGDLEMHSLPMSDVVQPSPESTTPELRWSLAHEWAHVVRGDVRLWSLAGVIRTVYFYQPLCWWLRAQMRLCQDYLADAAAAQETSRETYAEFLATRAAGRPLAIGLGIAGGKSDLYRRVAMLVRNRRSLETHCPRWWSATAVGAAILLVFVAATFGDKSPTAAESAPRSVAAADDGKYAGAVKPNPARPEAEPAKQGPAKTEKGTPEGNLQKLLDGLFARSAAIKSGRFTAQVEWGDQRRRGSSSPGGPSAGGHAGPPAMMRMPGMAGGAGSRGMGPAGGSPFGGPTQIELVVSGESWRQRPGPDGEDFFISHVGRSLSYRDQVAQSPVVPGDESEGFEHTLTISWPGGPGDFLRGRAQEPIGAGTIWYSESIPYLREHVAAARLKGTARVNQIETQVIDWSVPADDAVLAYQKPNALLAGGGIFRVHVAPQLGHAVVKIEFIDRFDTAQSTFEFSEFKEVAAKIHFPHLIHLREGAREKTITVVKVANVNEPIKEREFLPPIPSGTRIQDQRPHRADVAVEGGENQPGAAILSLRSFITGAEYPEGLPAAMLAEMDRDILSAEEYRGYHAKQKAEKAKAAPMARRTSTKSNGSAPARRTMSYSGKTFNEWRQVLLGDLEPDTRVKALEALGAFGANGYGEEVATTIADALKNDDPAENNHKVQIAACTALVRCGTAGVPVLESQLGGDLKQSRLNAVYALSRLAATTDAVVPALLKAVADREAHARSSACYALAAYHLTANGVADALETVFHDEGSVQFGTVRGLDDSKAPAEQVVKLIARFLAEDGTNVSVTAAAVFCALAAATEENGRVLQSAVLDGGSQARKRFVEQLREQQRRRGISPELTVPVLLALLESNDSYRDLRGHEVDFATMIFEMIGKMPRDNAAAHAAIPILIKFVNEEVQPIGTQSAPGPGTAPAPLGTAPRAVTIDASFVADPRPVLAAAEAIGKFGTAAKEALPSLKRLLKAGCLSGNQLQWVQLETEKQWQARIQAIIDKIEAK